MADKKEIKICSSHSDYKVPLIWTFAFNGSEYWCPYCGCQEGMMGAGKDVPFTEALYGRLAIYKEHSEAFIDANSALVCSGMALEKRELDRRKEKIPPEIKLKYVEMAKSWEYKTKATKLVNAKVNESVKAKCVNCSYFMNCNKYLNEADKGSEGPCQDYTEKEITDLDKSNWEAKHLRIEPKKENE